MQTQATNKGISIASIDVKKPDGRVFRYVSRPFVWPWRLKQRRAARQALARHIEEAPQGAVIYVECASHPVARMRRRSRIA